jgi:hypothetical protein
MCRQRVSHEDGQRPANIQRAGNTGDGIVVGKACIKLCVSRAEGYVCKSMHPVVGHPESKCDIGVSVLLSCQSNKWQVS